ncbi:MAG: zinc-binding dehydrogenase [Alphaproteobacteria bacterium]|jgi:L-iditol 2-dehydrogenase|nr:L-threonine 3-dehydrogenase [Rhodospirillaceae bacterium]MDP6407644.1 zinc-binding dehydrogenase [Alphaproteobacteria bacterium]MDP6621295.1 zinc-binding dehydrogenase [Alphaproteobacteria bacterium]|tara:strand:- start:39 stop:1031 length:993 start_codon:yes stop_codon:yes gene_type:complete
MKTQGVVLAEPGRIEVVERELTIGPDDVLVETGLAGICGTDKNFYLGRLPRMNGPGYAPDDPLCSFPYAIGHEGGGLVRKVGARVRRFKPDDHVISFGVNATMASHFVAHENNLEPSPEGLEPEIACLGEAVACAMFSGLHSGVELGDVAVVFGTGFAGQIIAQVMKKKGAATLVAVDVVAEKLDLARSLGADVTIDASRQDVVAEILELTEGRGADVVAEVAGTAETVNQSIECVRHNGRLVFYSWLTQDVTLNISRLHHDSLTVVNTGLVHHTPEERRIWTPWALRPVVQGSVTIAPLINSRFPLAQAAQAFREDADNGAVVKTVLLP